MSILDDLLGDVPRAVFMDQHYLKLPFARAGGCAHLVDAAGWPMVDALLQTPGADVLAARQGQMWDGPGVPTRALLADGYTLRIRKAERHNTRLGELADGFRRAFAGAVDVHVYCTPANHAGFGWHYDAEDVFILQTQGSKEWWLRKNTVNPWPLVETIPADMRYERERMPAMRCDLRAGDWLYIPAGYWHRTQAGDESVSLSVGILSTTAMDVLDFLRRRLADSLLWRQRLPTPGDASTLSDEELQRRYREVFDELGKDLAVQLGRDRIVGEFLSDRRRHGPP